MQLDSTFSKPSAPALILSPEVDIEWNFTTSGVYTGAASRRSRISPDKASILREWAVGLGVEEPETRMVSQILMAGIRNGAFTNVFAEFEDCLVVLGELKGGTVVGLVSENLTIFASQFVAMTVG